MNDWLHVYCHVYNGAPILRYWLRHYQRFPATRLFVYFDPDNSDDGPAQVSACPIASARPSPLRGPADLQRANWASQEIRQSLGRAEWALWVDDDELVWKANLREHLSELKRRGIQIVHPRDGYTMASETFPTTTGQIYAEVTRGLPDALCPAPAGKPTLVDPAVELRWAAGKHRVASAGAPVYDDPAITWMHFRHLSDGYIRERNQKNYARWDALNTALAHGAEVHPDRLAEYQAFRRRILESGVDVAPEGLR